MFDYERYDHTYCRILKDGDEVSNRKRKISNASYDKISESDVILDQDVPPTGEKENGSEASREPVIIVRTKRPRKTMPVAVESKSTLQSQTEEDKQNVSLDKTDTVVDVGHKNDTARSKSNKSNTKKVKQSKNVETTDNKSEDSEHILTTQSGRRRKLTPKAKENIETPIAKPTQKQKKGKKTTNESTAATADDKVTDVVAATSPADSKPKTATKQRSSKDKNTGKLDVLKPDVKKKAQKLKTSTSKQKSKLIVVMKPTGRKANNQVKTTLEKSAKHRRSAMKQDIPAARIDVNNIVSGSRRSRR